MAKGKDLFGVEIRHLKDIDGRKVTLYGRTTGKHCKECEYFYSEEYAKTYHRCEKLPKKNWRANEVACALFNQREVEDESRKISLDM